MKPFCAIQDPPYWNGWLLSACMHTALVGGVLFLSHQIPTPQKPARNPVAVSFFTPRPTQLRTPPAHRPTIKKTPSTPTAKSKHVQPEPVPKGPNRSKPRTQTQTRQTVFPQKIVHPSVKPAPQPVTETLSAQPTTVVHTQKISQPTVRNGTISAQPMPQHTGITRQHTAAKVHASHSHKKPVHVNATADKVAPVTPRNPIIRNHNAPRPIVTSVRSAPLRQSVNALTSHEDQITRTSAREVMKQHVARAKSHATARYVFAKPARQQALFSSGSPVVQTRTTVNYTRQTRKARPVTTSRSASTGGFSPELLAFSKLLREKVTRTLKFPRLAKRLGYSGTTHVAIALSKTGIVRDLKVSQPSGYEILDKAAIVTLEKVLQTTKPPESIEIEQLVIPIAFNLKRN